MDELKIISLILFPQASQPSINQKKKFKSLYFKSVARNCHVSNKPKDDSAVILPPSSLSMLRLTGTRKGKKSKEIIQLSSHLRIELWTSRTEGRALTNCANPWSITLYQAKKAYQEK